MTGYCFVLQGGYVSWRNRKQTTIALSTVEAEYIYAALNSTAQETVWLKQLVSNLDTFLNSITILKDNQSTVAISKKIIFHNPSKHIAIKNNFVRNQVDKRNINWVYCPSYEMIGDFLTEGLARERFKSFTVV